MIEVISLSANYGINQIDKLILREGENLAVIGPNGAGKSTLLKLIFGMIPRLSGQVLLNGHDCQSIKQNPHQTNLSFMPTQEERIHGLSIQESVAIGFNAQRSVLRPLTLEQSAAIEGALKRVGLWSIRDQNVETLSSGQYQRVRIARQFALDRDFMLLDEPFSYLDAEYISKIATHFFDLSRQGRTLIISTQQLNHAAQCCQKMLLLDAGNIALFGTTEDVMRSETIRRVFKTEFVPITHPKTNGTQLLYPPIGKLPV